VAPLPHGVDIDLFANARRQPSLPPDRPVCAYFGTIREALDLDILRAASYRFPLRLIGPVRTRLEGFAEETEIVGPVPQDQVPELLRDVDVLLLPYAHSVFNQSVMPAKLFECLATGKPSIVSGLGTLYDYADLFYIRETPAAFLEAIEQCVHEPAELRQKRIACAEEHSYARRTNRIETYIQQALEGSLAADGGRAVAR
jgi:glycosyltransferase involved in cell wall biosynthesis